MIIRRKNMKVKNRFTFVVTYTFDGTNQAVADDFRNYLLSPIEEDGFTAVYVDQSTYASKRELNTREALLKLRAKLDELYRQHNLRRNAEDNVYVFSNPFRAFEADTVQYSEDIYQFDVFDFE